MSCARMATGPILGSGSIVSKGFECFKAFAVWVMSPPGSLRWCEGDAGVSGFPPRMEASLSAVLLLGRPLSAIVMTCGIEALFGWMVKRKAEPLKTQPSPGLSKADRCEAFGRKKENMPVAEGTLVW